MNREHSPRIDGNASCQGLLDAFHAFLNEHGPQGWWPVSCEVVGEGYHPGSFQEPKTRLGRFEICVGAILTQNTAWNNVQKALVSLNSFGLLDPENLVKEPIHQIQEAIRPAGYYVQKSRYLQNMAHWFLKSDANLLKDPGKNARMDLLSVKGIGPETADSILLYAYKIPTFVVDVYTRRIFSNLGDIEYRWTYDQIQDLFHKSLPQDPMLFQEFHAVIVAHAKRYFRKGRGMALP